MITRKQLMKKVYLEDGGVLTSAFGTPRDGGTRTHAGEDWDIAGGDHPNLYAPFNCVIQSVRDKLSTSERGRLVEMKVKSNWYITVQHDYKVVVEKGERIEAGQRIAVQGGSGTREDSYRSHVHIEWARYPFGDSRRKAVDPRIAFYPLFVPPKYPTMTVVVSDLNIRKGHGTDAEKTGRYMPLGLCTIYEKVLDDGFIWGRIDWTDNLWIALCTADGRKVYVK